MEIVGRNHGNGNLLFGIYDNLVELSVNYGRMAFTNESDGGQRRLPSMNLYTHLLTTFPPFPPSPPSPPFPFRFRFSCLFSFSMAIYKYIYMSISVLATRTQTQTEVVEQGLNTATTTIANNEKDNNFYLLYISYDKSRLDVRFSQQRITIMLQTFTFRVGPKIR